MKVDVVNYIESADGGGEIILDMDQQAIDHFVRQGVLHALTQSLAEMSESTHNPDQMELDL